MIEVEVRGSVFEVAHAGFDHGEAVCIAIFDRFGIAHRATGLYGCVDTCLVGNLDTVGEGEECVARHDGSVKVESERLCFGNGLTERVDTRGLPYSAAEQLTVFGQHDGVAFAVLYNFVGEEQIGCLGVGDMLSTLRSRSWTSAPLRHVLIWTGECGLSF